MREPIRPLLSSAPDVLAFGELLMDFVSLDVGRSHADTSMYRPVPGGAPANLAVAAVRLGASSAFIGKVGDEPFGHHLLEILRREGVDCRGARLAHDVRTTLNFIARPTKEGASQNLFFRNPGADAQLRVEELDGEMLASCRFFTFGSVSLTAEPLATTLAHAVQLARRAGSTVVMDVNFRAPLWSTSRLAQEKIVSFLKWVDVVKLNGAELMFLFPDLPRNVAVARVLDYGPKLCLLTLANDGAVFRTVSSTEHVAAHQVRVEDTTGCGDAFLAAMLACLARREGWEAWLEHDFLVRSVGYANAVAAVTATQLGVIPALPTAQEVEHFLVSTRGHV